MKKKIKTKDTKEDKSVPKKTGSLTFGSALDKIIKKGNKDTKKG